jgi:hypothetical protein
MLLFEAETRLGATKKRLEMLSAENAGNRVIIEIPKIGHLVKDII